MAGMEERRPDPDMLLRKIERSDRKEGHLKVFLGAMAGVGKTCAMLKAAHDKLQEGVDIVIGWVDTHNRAGTVKLMEGLPLIPPKKMMYKGHMFEEMDIDAILKRHPDIVIVDELAHTNIIGSRHKRRFQDVEEILKAGINVYTAVNIQHIESLNDVVAKITGVVVKETVPDSFFDKADAIEVIDIAPEELRKRLDEGKIYRPDQAQRALRTFFRTGNISALREMALRFTAQHVDEAMGHYMRENQINGPWQASGKVMVGVSASPFSADLLRAGARLARGLRAEMIAVHIREDHPRFPIGDAERARIERNMQLARELGAQTMYVTAEDFAAEFIDVARQENVTAVIVGKAGKPTWKDRIFGTPVDRIIRHSGKINVYVINVDPVSHEETAVIHTKQRDVFLGSAPEEYWKAIASSALMWGLIYFAHTMLQDVEAALLLLLPVLFSALWWGRAPSALAALSGVLCYDVFYVAPVYAFNVSNFNNLWSFATFLLVALLIGGRTGKMKREAEVARRNERTMRAMYEFSCGLASAVSRDEIARRLARQVGESFGRKTMVVFLDASQSKEDIISFDPGTAKQPKKVESIPDKEDAVVRWVYNQGMPAGCSTDTLQSADYLYMPLSGRSQIYGVAGINLKNVALTPAERDILTAWVNLAGVALERAALSQVERKADLLMKSEKLRTALFNSVSHELKTPLAAIMGSVSALLEGQGVYSKNDQIELLDTIQEGARRMDRLVINLLDSARMESGMMHLKKDWCDPEDVIGSAITKLKDVLEPFKVKVTVPDDMPMIWADSALIEQVLVNLIDNAAKYSLHEKDIEIEAAMEGKSVRFSVLDRGIGVPKEDLNRIFDKFYRVPHLTKISGTGLGLAICKGIVEAHGGRIWAEERPGGGVIFSFSFPSRVYEGKEENP